MKKTKKKQTQSSPRTLGEKINTFTDVRIRRQQEGNILFNSGKKKIKKKNFAYGVRNWVLIFTNVVMM